MENKEFELEVCENCGSVSGELVDVNGSSICKFCAEELQLETTQPSLPEFCVICGWPINREVEGRTLKGFLKVIKRWLRKHGVVKPLNAIKKLELEEGLSICRYDFFDLIGGIIERYSKSLAKKFRKEFVKTYDFQGSLIS